MQAVRTTPMQRLTRTPLRLLAATAVLALAAGAVQTARAEAHGRPDGMMGMAQPRHIDRMLDSINASAEQRAQIQQIVAAAQPDIKAQREAARKLHEQSRALFAQPNIDARAAETLRQQMQAQRDVASRSALQVMLDVSRVLTPEQRKTLADRMAQRRTMMDRHRGERDTLDKPSR